ncbi:MAG: hypothetical protein M0022_06760 [Desulfobacteraceae bacterium]|nr:hypothetical protein [Desulfobacteraceae bacterium]
MKTLKTLTLSILALGLVFSYAFAAGDIEKGKALFNDARLGGGTTGKSCNSCHPGGAGLGAADQKEFTIMGKKLKGLKEAINFCIGKAMKGKAIDPKSADMEDIIAYVKSLKSNAPPTAAPKKKKIEGC